ncbi:MAG: terminase small subunit [Ignavibacterium sp.]|nr:terminase small subunit [Ignavibacterium sp.]
MQKELTNREKLFALEYLADETMNAERAALKAGYSASVARTKAYVWVSKSKQNKKPHVAEFIDSQMNKIEENIDKEIESLTLKLKKILETTFLEILEEMDWDLSIEGLKKVSLQKRILITNVIPTKNGIRLVVFNKEKVIEMLAKKYGIFKEDLDDKGIKVTIDTNGLEKYFKQQ